MQQQSRKIRQIITILTLFFYLAPNAYGVESDPPPVVSDSDSVFGKIKVPLPQTESFGLIVLLNNILRLFFVVAGIYAFIRILVAGFTFINAGGDAKKIEQAWASIWQSLLGLAVIISAFAIATIAGLIFFGDPTAIVNPKIYGPEIIK